MPQDQKNKMLNTIIYCTNQESFNLLLNYHKHEVYHIEKKEFEPTLFKITNSDQKILIINDKYCPAKLKSDWHKLIRENDKIGFIYHSRTDGGLQQLIKKHSYVSQQGCHEANIDAYKYYKPLKEFLDTKNGGKKAQIFREITDLLTKNNQVNQSLKLLHNILDGNKMDISTYPKEVREAYKGFNITNYDNEKKQIEML